MIDEEYGYGFPTKFGVENVMKVLFEQYRKCQIRGTDKCDDCPFSIDPHCCTIPSYIKYLITGEYPEYE